jgi:HAD superfamily hydrolase (TIGR01549 family)
VERPVETIFFDWDYTLAHTSASNNSTGERLAKMFALADLPYSQTEIEAAMARYHGDVSAGKHPPIMDLQRRREIIRRYGHLFDYLGEKDRSWATRVRLYRTYAQLPNHLYQDSRPTLALLRQQDFKLGIITNHASIIRPVIEQLVGDLVPTEHVVISEEIGVHKPAKTIFNRAAARTRTRPSRCLLVGDNFEVDAVGSTVVGGYRASVWLDRKEKGANRTMPAGVSRITSLDQLPPILGIFNT